MKSIKEHHCRSCRQNIENLNNNAGKKIIKQNVNKFIEIFNEK